MRQQQRARQSRLSKDKAIFRTEIERALNGMISNEEGMRFQGLAVVLAKQKWPEFIASERKKDLGLDAYIPARLSHDGIGKGLACSITATLEKIKNDIDGENGFKKHVNDVGILLFATPCKVTNEKAKPWKESILKDFGIELQILSREDIITDLMKPENASICQSHLELQVSIQPTIEELITKARDAAIAVVKSWLAHPRLSGRPMIPLQLIKLDENGRETEEIFTLDDLQQALLQSRRIVLEAPAGRGKTTTLIQVAEKHCNGNELAFLIDLPSWLSSNEDLISCLAKMPPFRSRGLDAETLTQVYEAIPCSFLLNGWNEISGEYSDKAISALSELERSFPKAGIIVATRAHQIQPPLPGSFRVKLFPLNRKQRAEYIRLVTPTRAGELIAQLENDRVLDELSRTPFVLSEMTGIFLSGTPIPATKSGVLSAVMRLNETSDEHRCALARSPLMGRHSDYLAELAIQMTGRSTVTLDDFSARSIVSSVSRRLQNDGQITSLPETWEVLSALCAHHVLERIECPSVAFRFQHQQYQEWYASTVLKKYLLALVRTDDNTDKREFIRSYVNEPIWEEPLWMIAEEVGSLSGNAPEASELIKAGVLLVKFALQLDPVFAAEIAQLCGTAVWAEIGTVIGERLRSSYRMKGGAHKRCALAGMLASGSEDFKDILLPLITSDDQQVRLETYRSYRVFHVSTLGSNWMRVVKGWKDNQRRDFVGEVVRDYHLARIAEEFARTDPSPNIRHVALRALEWVGTDEVIDRILTSYKNEEFENVLREQILDDIPLHLHERARVIRNVLLEKIKDPKDRIRVLLNMRQIEADRVLTVLKDELTTWKFVGDGAEDFLLKSAIELIRKNDPNWVSEWVAKRIGEGVLLGDRWASYISDVPKTFRDDLLQRMETEDLEYRIQSQIRSILVATADSELAGRVFSRLCVLSAEIKTSPQETSKTLWEIVRQLEDLLRAIPINTGISGLVSHLSSKFDFGEYETVIRLLGRVGTEDFNLSDGLDESLRQNLRNYLKQGIEIVLRQDDFNGFLKSEAATALARIGDPDDKVDLIKLIQADIERVRLGRKARIEGDRGPMGNGGAMSWAHWNMRALEKVDAEGAKDVLLKLLHEPEYESDVIEAMIRLAQIRSPQKDFGIGRLNYRFVWEARTGTPQLKFNEERRVCYTTAIKQKISELMKQRSSSDNQVINGRLKMLSKSLAILDARESSDLVMEIMAFPGKWDGHTRVEALEALLLNGAAVRADAVFAVLTPVVEEATTRFHDDQNRYLLQRCLCLLPFVNPPEEGIARMKGIIDSARFPAHDLREIFSALGNSRSDQAIDYLLELHEKYKGALNHIEYEWVNALCALDNAKLRRVLMSLVDPEIKEFNIRLHHEYRVNEIISSHIANIARKDSSTKKRLYELCSIEVSPISRILIAGAVSSLGTFESICAGLNLVGDRKNPPIPYELSSGLECAFLGKRPYGNAGYVYAVEPICANEIRARLCEMVLKDENRKQSALELLGRIESWRLEHGRPNNEPRHPALDLDRPYPPIAQQDEQSVPTLSV